MTQAKTTSGSALRSGNHSYGDVMKKSVVFLTSVLALSVAVPVFGPRAAAQDRPQEQDRAQAQNHQDEARFQDKDRQAARDWYQHHRENPPEGFRQSDRLDSSMESHLRVGVVMDNDLRHRIHPVPADLLATLPPPPAGYRYEVVGGQIVLVDSGWRIHDIININL
jgi:Ni/Co efflux regulator RcnB